MFTSKTKKRVISVILILILLAPFVSLCAFSVTPSLAKGDLVNSAFNDILASTTGNTSDDFKAQVAKCIESGGYKNDSAANESGTSKGATFIKSIYNSWAPAGFDELKEWLGDKFTSISKGTRKSFRTWMLAHTNDYLTLTVNDDLCKVLGASDKIVKKTILTLAWGVGFTTSAEDIDKTNIQTDDMMGKLKNLVGKKKKKKVEAAWRKLIRDDSMYSKINRYLKYGFQAAAFVDSVTVETTSKAIGGKLPHHDGKLMAKKNIYRKLKDYAPSFDKVKNYIDVAIPYATKCTKVNSTAGGTIGDSWMNEGDFNIDGFAITSASNPKIMKLLTEKQQKYSEKKRKKSGNPQSSTFKASKDIGTFYAIDLADSHPKQGYKKFGGVIIYQDCYGTQFVLTAVQGFFSKNVHMNQNSDYKYSDAYGFQRAQQSVHSNCPPTGTLIDAIFDDGTVMHCVQFDENGDGDTNKVGGKYDYYSHIVSTGNGNCLELCGVYCMDKFIGKYAGTRFKDSGNHVNKLRDYVTNKGSKHLMYYRIYDANIQNPKTYSPKWTQLICKDPDVQLTNANLNNTDEEGQKDPNAKDPTKDNTNYGGVPERNYVTQQTLDEKYVDLITEDDLSDDELYNVKMWQEDVESTDLQVYIIDASRWFIILLGILIIIWMIIIYICYWLDTVNNFVDIEFLPAVTFKRLRRAELEEDVTWTAKGEEHKGGPRTIDHKRLLIVVILGIILGALVVSGKLFLWTANIMNWVFNLFGDMWNAIT